MRAITLWRRLAVDIKVQVERLWGRSRRGGSDTVTGDGGEEPAIRKVRLLVADRRGSVIARLHHWLRELLRVRNWLEGPAPGVIV